MRDKDNFPIMATTHSLFTSNFFKSKLLEKDIQAIVVYVGAVQPGGGGECGPPCINIAYRVSGLQPMY